VGAVVALKVAVGVEFDPVLAGVDVDCALAGTGVSVGVLD
jgi:hypothetical protein